MENINKTYINKGGRVVFIDFLRIIACFLIIANHTGWQVVIYTEPSPVWFISLAYFYISRIAIPIFVMISGYVMLDRPISYNKSFKRAGRFAIVLIIFSMVYYLNGILTNDVAEFDIMYFVKQIISGPITNILWYLYLYIGLSIMMPFIQKMVAKFKKKDFHVFFAISVIVCSIWPIIVHYIPSLNYSDFIALQIFEGYIFLLILGLYLKKYGYLITNNRIVLGILFGLSCLINVILTYADYLRFGGDNYLFYAEVMLLPLLTGAICCFSFISQVSFSDRISKKISFVGKLTFGIYLVADLFIEKLEFVYTKLCEFGFNSMIAVVIYALAVFLSSGIVVFLVRKIPGVKRLL